MAMDRVKSDSNSALEYELIPGCHLSGSKPFLITVKRSLEVQRSVTN